MSMSNLKQALVKLVMVHLLSAVKLKSSMSAEGFAEAVQQLSASLKQQQLLTHTGPIGKRYLHPIMDTDEADLDTFFVMSFESRVQLEAAVAHMTPRKICYRSTSPTLNQMDSYRFTRWED